MPGNAANSEVKPVILHCNLLSVCSLTYPVIVFAVDIGSLINKEFHCALLKFFNCNVQGCSLIKRLKKIKIKTVDAILVDEKLTGLVF